MWPEYKPKSLELPENWDKMSYGEKLIWLSKRQEEIRRKVEELYKK